MRSTLIPAALAVAIVTGAAVPAAALMPPSASAAAATTSAATPVQYYYGHRYHHRRGGWVPYPLRGFEDPGYAYHGNINGCAEDLGYGRWESCDRGR